MNQKELDQAFTDANEIIYELGLVTGLENQITYSSVNGFLEPYGEALAKEALERKRRETLTIGYQRLFWNHVVNKTQLSIEKFKAPQELIPLQNGILNVLTGQVIPYSKDLCMKGLIFTSKYPVNYDSAARCPKILATLKRAQPDPAIQFRILRSFAICLDRTPIKRQTELWIGPPDTGKTTLLKVLEAFLGRDMVSNQTLQALTGTEQESLRARADLFNKSANIDGDLEEIEIKQVGMYKALTGGDTISARFMYQDPIKYAPYAKLFEACNTPPLIREESIWNDTAFLERFRITFFSQELDGKEIIDGYYKELTTPEELSGLLNILIGILRSVWETGDYGFTWNAKETRHLWDMSLKRSDKIHKVISSKCILTPDERSNYISVNDLADSIKKSFQKEGYEVPSRTEINERLRKICGEQSLLKGVPGRVWRGIKWKESQNSLDNNYNEPSPFPLIVNRDGSKYKKRPVISVIDKGDKILRIWFSNPLLYQLPRCQNCKHEYPTTTALQTHLKIVNNHGHAV